MTDNNYWNNPKKYACLPNSKFDPHEYFYQVYGTVCQKRLCQLTPRGVGLGVRGAKNQVWAKVGVSESRVKCPVTKPHTPPLGSG